MISTFTAHCTESLGVEHLSQVVGSQRVDGEDALVRKPPLAAGYEDRQQLTVCRDVAAGIVVDFTVWHQNVDRGWAGDRKGTDSTLRPSLNKSPVWDRRALKRSEPGRSSVSSDRLIPVTHVVTQEPTGLTTGKECLYRC